MLMSEVFDSSTKIRRKIVSVLFVAFSSIVLIAGFISAVMCYIENQSLATEIQQLEEELGVMRVADTDRVYFVAIDNAKVPGIVTENVDRIWQFRYFLPADYSVSRFAADGRVAAKGLYIDGGSTSGWSSPSAEAINKRLTISFTKKENRIDISSSLGVTLHCRIGDPGVSIKDLIIEPLVLPGDPARSFGPKEIIPLFKIYDPASAKEEIVDGQKLTTYSGALIVMCPHSEEPRFKLLREGKQVKPEEGSEGSNRE